MNKRSHRRNNFNSRMMRGAQADTIELFEGPSSADDSVRCLNQKPQKKLIQPGKLSQASTTDITTLTKDLIDSGQALYINVMGEKDEEIIRPVSIDQLSQVRTRSNRNLPLYGINEYLSKPQQSVLCYLSSEYIRKEAQDKIKDAIQSRQQCSRGNSSKSHRVFYASNKAVPESTGQMSLSSIGNFERPDRSKDALLTRKSLGLELYRRERRLTQLSQEKDEQLAKWMQKYRQHRKLFQPSQETKEERRASIRLQNTDKYNIGFMEYLKKKTNRKIEKDLIDKVMSRRDNVVEHYQQYMMKQMTLGDRSNKQNLRKCFNEINNEMRHRFV